MEVERNMPRIVSGDVLFFGFSLHYPYMDSLVNPLSFGPAAITSSYWAASGFIRREVRPVCLSVCLSSRRDGRRLSWLVSAYVLTPASRSTGWHRSQR
jgi:hypothetical protein